VCLIGNCQAEAIELEPGRVRALRGSARDGDDDRGGAGDKLKGGGAASGREGQRRGGCALRVRALGTPKVMRRARC